MKETFKRVAFNLDVIHNELRTIGYQFTSDIKYDWQKPILPPDPKAEFLLAELRSRTKNCGHIPLSLEYFYKIVGSCNFCWDWEVNPHIPWEGAAPIDIPPIKDLLEMVYDDYDSEDILVSGDFPKG